MAIKLIKIKGNNPLNRGINKGKIGRPTRYDTGCVRHTLRIHKEIHQDLRLLYYMDNGFRKGRISWNSWLGSILFNYAYGRKDDLKLLKSGILEAWKQKEKDGLLVDDL
jgi:hypothetical protein